MRIDGWFIDGFGTFRHHEARDLAPGLTVFLGPNEAGKSTLLAFVRAMLFGFPRSIDQRHEPLHGGKHGGRLFLKGPGGDFTLERHNGRQEAFRLLRHDGTDAPRSELEALLGHTDQAVFKSVFAFGLDELHNPKFHKEDGVRERIFAGSLQGARTSAREALKTLDAQNDPVHKARGRNGALIELQGKLEEARRKTDEARRQAESYSELLRQAEACTAEIGQLKAEQLETEAQAQRHRLLIELWPKARESAQVEAELSQLEPLDAFPAQAPEAFRQLTTRLDELVKVLRDREAERDDLLRRIANVRLDEAISAIAPRIALLNEERIRFQEWTDALAADQGLLAAARKDLGIALEQLGPGWDRSRLEALDVSLPKVDEVREWGRLLDQAEALLEERRRESGRVLQELRDAKSVLESRREEAEKLGAGMTDAQMDEREATLIRLKTQLVEHGEKKGQITSVQERLEDLALDRKRPIAAPTPLPMAIRAGLWGIALLLLALGAWAFLQHLPLMAVVLVALAIGLGVLSMRRVGGDGATETGKLLDQQLKELNGKLTGLEAALKNLENVLSPAATAIGLSPVPTMFEIEAAIQRLVRDREQAKDLQARRQDISRAEGKCSDLEGQQKRCQEDVERAQAERDRLLAEWSAWRARLGFDEARSPQGVIDLIQQIHDCRSKLRALQDAEGRCAALEAKLSDYRLRAYELLDQAGAPRPTDDAQLIQAIAALQQRQQSDHQARTEHQALVASLEGLNFKLAQLAKDEAELRDAQEALLSEAGASDAAELEHRFQCFTRRRELKQTLQALRLEIDGRIGEGAKAEELRALLGSGEVEAWREALLELQTQADERTVRLDEANQRLGQLKDRRQELEKASDVIAREHDYAALHDEFRRVARSWQVRAIARAMVDATIKELERTRQPRVLAYAADLFETVTEGRYRRLVQHDGGDLRIEDTFGKQSDLSVLSRGTAEQLYLCLRLGFIREFAVESADLPLVMDDVLVNFDPERAERVARALVRFSEDHQVLLFTCQPQSAELFRRIRPETRVIELPRYGGILEASVKEALPVSGPEAGARSEARALVLQLLAQCEAPVGRGEILRKTGLPETEWGPTITRLKDEGLVLQQGDRKGATYSLASKH